MKVLKTIKFHLSYWPEFYIAPLVVTILTYIGIWGVNFFTQQPVIDDPGIIVGSLYNLIKINLVVLAVSFTQSHLFGFRSEKGGSLKDDLYDGFISIFLISLYSFLMWH